MTGWMVHGIELPFGDARRSWWVDESGVAHDAPIGDAEVLPGRYVLAGLVDAHAHPAVTMGSSVTSPDPLGEDGTRANLVAWAESGITLVRDVGSPGGVTLNLSGGSREPVVRAAGRFLAPEGRYFPALLVEPVADTDLVDAALREVQRGATWVKVIADFPHVPEFTDNARTYPVEFVAALCDAVHHAGARVAAHSTLPDVGPLVFAGVDSIEHGPGLDASVLEEMGRRKVAWTPTLCAMFNGTESSDVPPERRQRAQDTRSRLAELLPLAVRLGVPVLAGTDVVGSIPREVALLAELGLAPSEALAAASVWGRQFIGAVSGRVDIVTYEEDPRDDPTVLARPHAVVVDGTRLR